MRTAALPLLRLAPSDADCRKRPPRDARFVLPANVHHRAHVLPVGGAPGGVTVVERTRPLLGGVGGRGAGATGRARGRLRALARMSAPTCAALAFSFALLLAVVGGLVGVLTSPTPRASFGDGQIQVAADATCVRASRHADYVTVDLAFGTPRAMLSLLLRLDVVTEENSIRLFSTRVVESLSVECSSQPIACMDIFIAQLGGPASDHDAVPVHFNYTNFINEEYGDHPYAWKLQLDGEMRLRRGYEYTVTATHVCWTKAPRSTYAHGRQLHAVTDADGAPTSTVDAVVAFAAVADAPLARGVREHNCRANASAVRIFPGAAAYESEWLAIGSPRVYEAAEGGIAMRRTVVEVGRACAEGDAFYAHAQSLYRLDCAAWDKPCADAPSLPWRRLATAVVALWLPLDSEDYHVAAVDDVTLYDLPTLDADHDPLAIAVVKLLLMTLAAAVVWIRAAKQTASNAHLLRFAVREAFVVEAATKQEKAHPHRKAEDAVVGLLAVGARVAVSAYRYNELVVDQFGRLPVVQLVAGALSLVHMAIRYGALQEDTSALLRLGGSTALVDAPAAVLIGFATPPLLTSASGQFDPTARMLTALLVTLVSLPRCAFAAACCTVRAVAGARPDSKSRMFVLAATVSALMWLAQALSIGLLLADGFAASAGYSLHRSLTGSWLPLSVAAFASVVAAAQPQLVRGLIDVATTPQGE